MFSPMMSLKPLNTTTSLLFSKKIHWLKIPERIEYKVISLTYNIIHFNPPSPPISVSGSRSNLLVQRVPLPLEHSSALLSPRHSNLLTALYYSHSCLASLEQTPASIPTSRQLSDPSYELTKTSPLAISPQLFHSKLKTLFFNKSYHDFSSFPYLPPRLNFKHHPQ